MSDVKPCIFCGSRNTEVWGIKHKGVRCEDCGAEGPLKYTNEQAITAWDTRSEAPQELIISNSEAEKLIEIASGLFDYDTDNACPVCRCCNVELNADDTGHKDYCLANAILKSAKGMEHLPAKQEPITPEALKALGFVEDLDSEDSTIHEICDLVFWVSDEYDTKWQYRDEDIPGPTTVRELKDLCRYLGITLKEETK